VDFGLFGANQNHIVDSGFIFAAVIIASIANAPQNKVDLWAIGFVLARIAYLVCYIANWSTARSIVWLLGLACAVVIFFQI
jgi:uncharacterized MAPEG superfamily protein